MNRAERRKNRAEFRRVYKLLRAGKKIKPEDKTIAAYLISQFLDQQKTNKPIADKSA